MTLTPTPGTPVEPISKWLAAQMRFTALFRNSQLHTTGAWKTLLGSEPEQTVIAHSPPSRQEVGMLDGHVLILGTMPIRTDLLLTPNAENLPPIEATATSFRALSHRYMDLITSPTRLAVGMQAFLPTSSPDDTYAVLSRLLPCLKLDTRPGRDLSFRINMPTSSVSSPSLKINCLTEWTAISLQSMAIDPNLFSTDNGGSATLGERHFVRVSTDVNTLPHQDLSRLDPPVNPRLLLDDMYAIGLSAIERGDA